MDRSLCALSKERLHRCREGEKHVTSQDSCEDPYDIKISLSLSFDMWVSINKIGEAKPEKTKWNCDGMSCEPTVSAQDKVIKGISTPKPFARTVAHCHQAAW